VTTAFRPSAFHMQVGTFTLRVGTDFPALAATLGQLYAGFPTWPAAADRFADFHIEVVRPRNPLRWLRPQANFLLDGAPPFLPLGAAHALLVFEGGLNWTIAEHVACFLVVHAATVERHGRAVVLPAESGSGKSTLTAALVQRGWRLLSDEFALIAPADGTLAALARPISLKNESIGIIRDRASGAFLTAPLTDTTKGTIAFLRPPAESVQRMQEPARPGFVVVPKYDADVPGARLTAKSRPQAFRELHANCYNFHRLGRRAFELLADLVDRASCHDLRFGDLDAAVDAMEALTATA
jgi:HprK-related kinase A